MGEVVVVCSSVLVAVPAMVEAPEAPAAEDWPGYADADEAAAAVDVAPVFSGLLDSVD